MVNAVCDEVANVVGDDVEKYKKLFDERSVHALLVREPSERASCALVLDASWRVYCGVDVPIPRAPSVLFHKNAELPLSAVAFANWTAPVPPTADEPEVRHVLLMAKQPPERLKPFAPVDVAVPVRLICGVLRPKRIVEVAPETKFALLLIENSEPGVVVPIPINEFVPMKSDDVAERLVPAVE